MNEKRFYDPLQPQPMANELLRVHRMYQTLKHSTTGPDQFKRRITWFEKMENLFPHISTNIIIAEYIVKFES